MSKDDWEVEVEWVGGPQDGGVFKMDPLCSRVALATRREPLADDPPDAPLFKTMLAPVKQVRGKDRRVAVWAERQELA